MVFIARAAILAPAAVLAVSPSEAQISAGTFSLFGCHFGPIHQEAVQRLTASLQMACPVLHTHIHEHSHTDTHGTIHT